MTTQSFLKSESERGTTAACSVDSLDPFKHVALPIFVGAVVAMCAKKDPQPIDISLEVVAPAA